MNLPGHNVVDYKLENYLTMVRFARHYENLDVTDHDCLFAEYDEKGFEDGSRSETVKRVHVFNANGDLVAGAYYSVDGGDYNEAADVADIFSVLT